MRNHSAAFTLLELVVVLAILSIVTVLAVRSLDGVEDQRRYEANQRAMNELEFAVLGSPDDRAADGSRIVSGFVADMGRLPATVLAGANELTLAELWVRNANPATPLPPYDVRSPAIDPEVQVPGGWRGPYLRLPFGTTNLLDAWGNPVHSLTNTSPDDPLAKSVDYPRLQDASGALPSVGHSVEIVQYLGANGTWNTADTGVDHDFAVSFVGRYTASVRTSVDVLDQQGKPSVSGGTDVVIVRVYGPNPADASQIAAIPSDAQTLISTPVNVPSVSSTIGPRAVRAYLYQSDGTTLIAKSNIKYVTLVSGVNFVPLTIYRPASSPSTP